MPEATTILNRPFWARVLLVFWGVEVAMGLLFAKVGFGWLGPSENGMAVLLITHDLGVVAEFCDRVAVMDAGRIVEEAPAATLFAAPGHRYTEALLRSMPAANPPGRALPSIPGSVPPPAARGAGCVFAPRCGYAVERCSGELPALSAPPHRLRCWNPAGTA